MTRRAWRSRTRMGICARCWGSPRFRWRPPGSSRRSRPRPWHCSTRMERWCIRSRSVGLRVDAGTRRLTVGTAGYPPKEDFVRIVGWVGLGLALLLFGGGGAWAAVSVQGEVQVIFTPDERKIIKEYYSKEIVVQAREADDQGKGKGKGKKGLPPGLAKRERLPPGLQKQLRRNGTLPPGLQKKLEPLPQS